MDRMRGRRTRVPHRASGRYRFCPSVLEIGGVGPHVAAFRDGSVKPRKTYPYRVHAWNASGDSSPSNVMEVTTPRSRAELPAD